MLIDTGMDPNIGSAIGANVVLIGTELAALCGDTLQLLLRRGVGIADLHQHALFSDRSTVILLDNLFAFIAGFKAAQENCQNTRP